MPAFASASQATSRWLDQISSASCSTQPGCGKCWLKLALGQCDNFALAIENDGPRRRCALIQGHQILRSWHMRQPKRRSVLSPRGTPRGPARSSEYLGMTDCYSKTRRRRLLDAVIVQSCTLKGQLSPQSADLRRHCPMATSSTSTRSPLDKTARSVAAGSARHNPTRCCRH